MTATILWFRRDLRLGDNPALLSAIESADEVLPVFVLDPRLAHAGAPRTERLKASLAALLEDTDGALVVRTGDPAEVIPDLARQVDAEQVHIARETTPFGRRRDERVREALHADGHTLHATGTPYAVAPGRLLTQRETPFGVFTPFWRAWQAHGWPTPASRPSRIAWHSGVRSETIDVDESMAADVGESRALQRWREFRAERLQAYPDERDRPDIGTTSKLSTALKFGEIHPRTMLAETAGDPGAAPFVRQLCWREFYADVLWHEPRSAWHDLRPSLGGIEYDSGPATDELIEAWKAGRTGYPMVDAGLRQLLQTGWMHNRVRLLTASFLVKDLHVWWPIGARHFLDHLLDGDLASNNHGWQWVAGTGTDAAPYFRIFNPTTQALRFDPEGDYVRRWVPELAHLTGAAAHTPWEHPDGYDHGYPQRVLDHAEERVEALARYNRAREGN